MLTSLIERLLTSEQFIGGCFRVPVHALCYPCRFPLLPLLLPLLPLPLLLLPSYTYLQPLAFLMLSHSAGVPHAVVNMLVRRNDLITVLPYLGICFEIFCLLLLDSDAPRIIVFKKNSPEEL